MANIISTGSVRVFGDGYKGSMEENSTYGVAGVLWDFSWRSGRAGVGIVDSGGSVWFYGILGYLMPHHFYTYKQFYFK